MRILLANDDGIDAPGIRALADALKEDYEVYVSAPSTQKSAMSHSVTYFFHTVTGHPVEIEGVKGAWAIDGTPADSVYLGMKGLMDEMPDLVITGINQGRNLSVDCVYSGTVGAAEEALLYGVPAIAASLTSYTSHDFSAACAHIKRLIPLYMADPNRTKYLLNVNVPALSLEEIKGIKFVDYEKHWEYHHGLKKEIQEDGSFVFKTKEDFPQDHIFGSGGDGTAVHEGYVSISPIGLDQIQYDYLETLEEHYTK